MGTSDAVSRQDRALEHLNVDSRRRHDYPRRVHSDPSTKRLLVTLRRMVHAAKAQVGAVFVPREDSLVLAAQIALDQPALDVVHACWFRNQAELRSGTIVRYSATCLWPLFKGPQIAALLYLDRVPPDFPDNQAREDAALLAARAPMCGKPSPLATLAGPAYRPADMLAEIERDRLVMLLRQHRGNVSDVACAMGVCRDTVYKLTRDARPPVDIDEFRPRRPGRRPRRKQET